MGWIKNSLLLLCCSFSLILYHQGHCQQTHPFFLSSHFTDADGLTQNSIKSIAQDKAGFYWCTTENAIVRWDGRQFSCYHARELGLTSDRFSTIVPDPVTHTNLAFTEKEVFFRLADGQQAVDKKYTEKLASAFDFLPGLPDFTRFPHAGFPPMLNTGLRSWGDTGLMTTDLSALFLWNKQAVSFYKDKKIQYTTPFASKEHERFFVFHQQLYYWGEEGVVYRIEKNKVCPLTFYGSIPGERPGGGARLYQNPNNPDHLFLYEHNKFYKLIPGEKTFEALLLIRDFDAIKNGVVVVYQDDPSNTLLMGSTTSGLYVFFQAFFQPISSILSGNDNVYYAQLRLDGHTILTAQGEILDTRRPGKGQLIPGMVHRSDKYNITADQEGYVWTKKFQRLHRINPGKRKDSASWLFPVTITALLTDRHDQLWLGMEDGTLLHTLAAQPVFDNRPDAYLSSPIVCMEEDSAGMLWLGTNKGLYSFNPKTGRCDTISGLEGKAIRSLHASNAQQVWITTYERGLFLYEPGRLISFPLDAQGYLQTAHCILEDKKGYLWISTNKGLFQAAKSDLLNYAKGVTETVYYHFYDKMQGMATNEFNGGCLPCGIQLSNGLFSFPTLHGLLWFYPDSLPTLLPDKEIFVDKLWIDNQVHIYRDTLELDRSLHQLKLSLITPYTGHPNNVHMWYALENKDRIAHWLPVDNGSLTLSTIPPGEYRLRIRKANGFGNHFSEKIIYINVPVHWMLRPGMLLLWIVILAGTGFLFVYLRTAYIKRKNQELKERIAEQTKALRETLEALEQSQGKLVQQTDFHQKMLAVLSHDIKAPLKYLLLTTEKIQQGLKLEGSSAYIEANKTSLDYIRRLYYTMDNMLRYIKTQLPAWKVTFEMADARLLVEDKVLLYAEIAAQADTRIVNKVPAGLMVNTNTSLLLVILHNLIDNSVKVTEEGNIIITAEKRDDTVALTILDTGIGMEAALVAWINDEKDPERVGLPYQASEPGIGLMIVKGIASLLRIRLLAVSSGEGTSFTLFIPASAMIH